MTTEAPPSTTSAPPVSTPTTVAHTYKFNINMSCGGCSGAIERVLKKLDGVASYTVSLETQTATAEAGPGLGYWTVLGAIRKTGKKVNSGERDGVEMGVEGEGEG